MSDPHIAGIEALPPELLETIFNLTLEYRHFEDTEKAVSSITESSRLYEKLAEEYPEAFNERYAKALNVLRMCLVDVGRDEEAREVEQRAVLVRAAIVDES